MSEKPKLASKKKETNHIDWLTYSYVKKSGKVGLGEYLAAVSDCPNDSVELLESPNDTHYTVEISMSDVDKDSHYLKFDHEKMTQKINGGGVEYYCMHQVFCWLLYHGHIKPGNYVVSMSW